MRSFSGRGHEDDPGGKNKRFSGTERFRENIIQIGGNYCEKDISLLEIIAFFFMAFPMTAWAAEGSAESISPVFCIPFAGLLLCVAVLPLVKAEWWVKSSASCGSVLVAAVYCSIACFLWGRRAMAEKVLECIIDDYLTFIVLLFGLFCVAGNITLEGDLAGSPRINVGLLLLGTMLSSWVGTTGASMLMVRPMIKMNAWRKRRSHIMVVFYLPDLKYRRLSYTDRRSAFVNWDLCVEFQFFLESSPTAGFFWFNAVVLLTVFIFWIAELTERTLQKEESQISVNLVQKYIF